MPMPTLAERVLIAMRSIPFRSWVERRPLGNHQVEFGLSNTASVTRLKLQAWGPTNRVHGGPRAKIDRYIFAFNWPTENLVQELNRGESLSNLYYFVDPICAQCRLRCKRRQGSLGVASSRSPVELSFKKELTRYTSNMHHVHICYIYYKVIYVRSKLKNNHSRLMSVDIICFCVLSCSLFVL